MKLKIFHYFEKHPQTSLWAPPSRWGKLCGEGVQVTDRGSSSAWVGIQEEFGLPGSPWVQMGYLKLRLQDSTRIDYMVYWELQLPISCVPFPILREIAWVNLPTEGETYYYEVFIDVDIQRIFFKYDLSIVDSLGFTPCVWESTTGRWAVWSGEIAGYETDMPGMGSDSCCIVS